MLGRTDRRLRLLVLLVAFAVMGMAAVVRLSYWQLARGPELRTEAMAQVPRPAADQPVRGNILDRNGAVLATTSYRYVLSAAPDVLSDLEPAGAPAGTRPLLDRTVERLTEILQLSEADAATIRAELADAGSQYAVLHRRLTGDQADAIQALMQSDDENERLVALQLDARPERFYPNPGGAPGTTLASHLLGFVSDEGVGNYGIEQYYDAILAGRSGQLASAETSAQDDTGAPVATSNGADITLTIDAGLQLQLERELYSAWVADQASRASGLILDPETGEVLAWASVPGYDANDFRTIASSSPESFIDPIATSVFEPGSVMKMLTAAAAFDAGIVDPETEVSDGYRLTFGLDSVYNYDGLSRGRLPFRDAIAFSRNVATARVAGRLGATVERSSIRLHEMWSRLGIGELTGVDIVNESAGIVSDPRETEWTPIDLANRSFGQGVAVTQVQLAAAYTAMANGGVRVTPHFLMAADGEAQALPDPERALPDRRADELRDLMNHVTRRVPWYRDMTQIPGYAVGGKTGTAQIWDARAGNWKPNTYNFSFVGYVGAQEPEAIIAVRLHDVVPHDLGRGNLEMEVPSYALFSRIAAQTVSHLEIPPLEPVPTGPGAAFGPPADGAGSSGG